MRVETSVGLPTEVKEDLDELKRYDNEPYWHVIARLVNRNHKLIRAMEAKDDINQTTLEAITIE